LLATEDARRHSTRKAKSKRGKNWARAPGSFPSALERLG
jgi:hypothetical protein